MQVKALPLKTTYWNNLKNILTLCLSVALVLISRLRDRIIIQLTNVIIQHLRNEILILQTEMCYN
jgi:hypothetical protein